MSSKPPGADPSISFPALVQDFFTHYLVGQLALSPRTVAGYRDAFILSLTFAHQHLGTWPAAMKLADVTPALILAFLDHLEQERHNSVCSRNARLAALRAFLKFASHRAPSALQIIEQALAVPMKRFEHPKVHYLSGNNELCAPLTMHSAEVPVANGHYARPCFIFNKSITLALNSIYSIEFPQKVRKRSFFERIERVTIQ